MRKKLLACIIILLVSCGVLFAEHGIEFGADMSVGFALKPFVSQMANYRFTFDNDCALGAGVRVSENFFGTANEDLIIIIPYGQFSYKSFYLNGGAIIPTRTVMQIAPYVDLGFRLGNWKIGNNRLAVSLGLEFSPTYVEPNDTDDDLGRGLGAIFLTVFNVPKIQLGAKLYMPF